MRPSTFCEVIFVAIQMSSILRALQAACPPGWVTWQDSCYILLPQKMGWSDASKACDRPGESIFFPNSMEEQTFVWEEMSTRMRELGAKSPDDLHLWINCYRYDELFNCSDNGETSSFRYWGGNGPSLGPNEYCIRMAGAIGGRWSDIECYFKYFVACEMSTLAYGNPCRALQAACPPGWVTWQDSCYILLPQMMGWSDASKACDRPGESLFFPSSMEEQTFVWEEMSTRMRELGAKSPDDLQLWINCYRYDERFNCSDNEETSSFRYWDVNGPSLGPNEHCARMAGAIGGRWADIECYFKYFVACEMSALAYGNPRRPNRRYSHVPQQCLLNHQIKSYPVKESIGCGLACWVEPLCRSFNLWKQADNKTSCQLNYASRMEVDVIDFKYEENCYFFEP